MHHKHPLKVNVVVKINDYSVCKLVSRKVCVVMKEVTNRCLFVQCCHQSASCWLLLTKCLVPPLRPNNLQVYSVTEYTVKGTNVSIVVQWKVNDQKTALDNLEYLLSYTKKTTPGNPVVWKNMTWTTNTVSFCSFVSCMSGGGCGGGTGQSFWLKYSSTSEIFRSLSVILCLGYEEFRLQK